MGLILKALKGCMMNKETWAGIHKPFVLNNFEGNN